jgi:hypothetical protein
MKQWLQAGFFNGHTQVKKTGAADFVPLETTELPPPKPAAQQPEKWYYMDDDGKEQGPWSHSQMRQWFIKGFLAPTVRVRVNDEKDFVPINERQCSFVPSQVRTHPRAPLTATLLLYRAAC